MSKVSNDDVIKAVFSATPEAKIQALKVLTGRDPVPTKPLARLLTIKEVAERFGCTTRTVQRWIATGQIDFVRRGHLVRIPESALQES